MPLGVGGAPIFPFDPVIKTSLPHHDVRIGPGAVRKFSTTSYFGTSPPLLQRRPPEEPWRGTTARHESVIYHLHREWTLFIPSYRLYTSGHLVPLALPIGFGPKFLFAGLRILMIVF